MSRPLLDQSAAFIGPDGAILANGILSFFEEPGPTPEAEVFANADLTGSLGSDVSLDDVGVPPRLFFDPSVNYGVIVKDSDGEALYIRHYISAADETDETILAIVSIDTIADLQAETWAAATIPNALMIVSRATPGDGGGFFRLDASDVTSPDNGTTIIVDGINQRWKWQTPQELFDHAVTNGLTLGAANTPTMRADGADVMQWDADAVKPLLPVNDFPGGTIAADSTIDLDAMAGNYGQLTGIDNITAVVLAEGAERELVIASTPIFVNSASLICISDDDVTAAAGDTVRFRGEAAGVVRMVTYERFNGRAVVQDSVVFTRSFTSPRQTITAAGALTLAHGLGVTPKAVFVFLENTSAELGYTVGQQLQMPAHGDGIDQASAGQAIVCDATNINVRYGSAANVYSVLNFSTGNRTAIDPTKWGLVILAVA